VSECQGCKKKGDPTVRAAHEKLDELYVTDRRARGGSCPLDGSRAGVTFFRYRGVKIAYRKCSHGHALRL
jgi:hypothetical protein